jgi:hypothetical protein
VDMIKLGCTLALLLSLLPPASRASAEIDFSADVVSRNVWRGRDYGNAATVQPGITWTQGTLEIGAWSSWAITGAEANENDLHISYGVGPVTLMVSDFYFPTETESDLFNLDDTDGVHTIEICATYQSGPVSLMGALNVWGDSDDSFYVEGRYAAGEFDRADVGLTAGLGNGDYTVDTDPMVAHLSLDLSRDGYFASYILNPDTETTFLVFGRSF